MRLRNVLLLLAFLFANLLSGAASTVSAQTETGRVAGLVLDQTGAVVPGATITLTSTGSGAVRVTTSDAEGRYLFANVQAGPYTAKIELAGFTTQNATLVVNVGSTVSLETKLQVAGAAEVVSVVAESPVVNIANSEVSTTIREDQIRELPTLTRNVYNLVGLAGNVTPANTLSVGANNSGDLVNNRGAGFNINGARDSSTNILLDGAANNDEFVASIGQAVPLDSVQEFSVISNNFSAQFGRASGGVVNVITKSGTNNFRGTAYEFFRSDSLSTNTVDNLAQNPVIPKGQFKRNQPGFSLGGPIIKDKLQFFSSLENIRVRSADTQIAWVPTSQFLAASSPATQAFFNAYAGTPGINGPILTRADVSGIVGSGAGAFNTLPASLPVFARVDKSLPTDAGGGDPQDQYQFVGRVDWNQSRNTQVYIRYAYQNQEAQPGTNSYGPYAGFDTGYLNKNHNILGSVTHVYSSTLTSQTKLVWNRLFQDQPLNGTPQPTLYMNPSQAVRLQGYRIGFPGYYPFNAGIAIPFGGPQALLQLYHDQTWLKGDHDFRFGGSYVHIKDDRTFGAYENAVEALSTSGNALTSLNNFVTGNIQRFQSAINPQGYPGGTFTTPVQLPSFLSHNSYNEFAFYVQDNWSVTNRLKLNLGLRYEYYGPQQKSDPKFDSNFYYSDPAVSVNTSSPQQIIDGVRGGKLLPSNQGPDGTLWKADWNNFAPRLGFAWDATGDGRTAVRGGYGLAYERNFGNVTFNVLFNPPQYLVTQIDAPTDVPSEPIFVDNAGPFGGIAGVTKTIPAGSLRHIDQNMTTAYSHQYGASVQRELITGLSAAIEYNGSSGRGLYDLSDINRRGAPLIFEGASACTPACGKTTRPNPSFGAFNTRGNRGQSQYHGVTFSLDARKIADTGLALTTKYTLSRTKDNLSTTFSSDSLNSQPTGSTGYLDVFDPMLDYGYSNFDLRHRLNISAIWNLPFLRDGKGPMQTLLGGWSVNLIFTARSGYPFTIYDCSNALNTCIRAIDNANISKDANGDTATGNPNEYTLLNLAPILGAVGSYVNPTTGNNDFGPFPSNMTARNAFRGPGGWYADLGLSKRFRFGNGYAVQARLETFNLFNHANMYVHTDATDISSFTTVTGYKDGNRKIQLGIKFEF